MTTTQGLRTFIVRVGDMNEARAFYSKAFGVEPYFDEPFYMGWNIQGYELGMVPTEENTKVGNNIETYWGVEDMQAAIDHFVSCGARLTYGPEDVGSNIITAIVNDPWDNQIGLIINPHFKLPDND